MFIARYCDLLNVDISCDGCDEIAPWHRYRCLQCSDMDLCKTCFLGKVHGLRAPSPQGSGASVSCDLVVFSLPLYSDSAAPRCSLSCWQI